MRKVCSLPSQEMSLSNQGCPFHRRITVRITFYVKNGSLSPLMIDCNGSVLQLWYPMFGGSFFVISFFTPEVSLAQ